MLPLFEAYRAFYKCRPDAEGARRFLTERLERSHSVIFLARDAGGEAVGFTQLYPLFSSLELAPLWLLNDLYVVPAARRRGIAAQLIARAERLAAETGASRLELTTGSHNRTAQRVYATAGWHRDDEFLTYTRTVALKPKEAV